MIKNLFAILGGIVCMLVIIGRNIIENEEDMQKFNEFVDRMSVIFEKINERYDNK